MLLPLVSVLSVASVARGSVIRRQDPGLQSIPATGKPDNTFNNGAPQLNAEPPQTSDPAPDVYGARSIDLPFGRLYHGNLMFFPAGQLNTPDGITDQWINMPANPTQNGVDSANQSACGIPDNAYSASKVAIHPYFLKYADLSRYCMQDVCISFWKEDGSSDMMLKVTDICSTDPNDPTHCATPADIKVDRSKAMVMEGLTDPPDVTAHPEVMGNQFPDQVWWFFMKCWDDGLPQPAYQGNNWFTDPPLPNNLQWAQASQTQQTENNQAAYAAKGWPTYPNGAFNTERDNTTSPPISDWAPGDPTPAWSPIAGGKGWGNPFGSDGSPAAASLVASNLPAASMSLKPAIIPGPATASVVASNLPAASMSLKPAIIPGPATASVVASNLPAASMSLKPAIIPGPATASVVASNLPAASMSLHPAVIPGPSAAASAQGSGQGASQSTSQGGSVATSTSAGGLPPSLTPVPGLTQAGTDGEEQDECDEL